MTALRRTAIVMVLSVTGGTTMPVRAAVRGETTAEIKRDILSRTIAVRALTLDDEIALVPVGDSTPGHISTSSQLQPTNLKRVSGKKALILTAVVVAAVVLVMYVIAVAASKGLYSVSNKTAHLKLSLAAATQMSRWRRH